jgi:drug/metabolite transporter (DMT)-like permease
VPTAKPTEPVSASKTPGNFAMLADMPPAPNNQARPWPQLIISAILNVALWVAVMSYALLWLRASEAVVIAYTMPVWTALLAWPL